MKDYIPGIGDEPPAAFGELYPELEEALANLEVPHLAVLLEPGTHIATTAEPGDKDQIARLLAAVTRWALEMWRVTEGATAAERFFALFVAAMAESQGWTRRERRPEVN